MTNQEKAREYAAEKFKVNPESKEWNITTTYMSACEWKDEQYAKIIDKWKKEAEVNHDAKMAYEQGKHDAMMQFNEYLEKKKDEYLHQRENYLKTKGLEHIAVVSEIRKDTTNEIINELFKKEQK